VGEVIVMTGFGGAAASAAGALASRPRLSSNA
jgi:hypothetical protein